MASERSSTRKRVVIAAGIVGLPVALVWWFVWGTRPPQMGADEEVFTSVDALFTAVRARDDKLLGQCEQRLHALKGAGKLPGDASDYLDGVIKTAREGRWQAAAARLYSFMKAQRREGAQDHPTKKKEKGHPKPGQK